MIISRSTPAMLDHVVRLSEQDSGLHHSIVRFNNTLIDSNRQNPAKFFRREPVVIVNTQNNQRVIRYAMGNAGTYSIKKSAIGLDYDGVDALGIKFKETCELQPAGHHSGKCTLGSGTIRTFLHSSQYVLG